jgi:hypothetical protein
MTDAPPFVCDIWPQGVANVVMGAQGKVTILLRWAGNVAFLSCAALTGLLKPVPLALSGNRRVIPQARRGMAMVTAPVCCSQAQGAAGYGS